MSSRRRRRRARRTRREWEETRELKNETRGRFARRSVRVRPPPRTTDATELVAMRRRVPHALLCWVGAAVVGWLVGGAACARPIAPNRAKRAVGDGRVGDRPTNQPPQSREGSPVRVARHRASRDTARRVVHGGSTPAPPGAPRHLGGRDRWLTTASCWFRCPEGPPR